jgi:CRP-like cAMP-binding protein
MTPLLAALPREEYERLRPRLRRVPLQAQQVLLWPDTPISRVYFPITTVLSVLTRMGGGIEVEAGMIGSEGLLGLPVFLGAGSAPHRAIVQIAGEAWQMPAGAFREAVGRSAPLRELLGRYAQALFVQVAQAVGCNRTHTIGQRCARWLLMAHDRVDGDRFLLTQELLATMLGVRRPTVSKVMAGLQRRGLIEYSRGHVAILDRPGLETASCVCYHIISAETDRLLGGASA